MTAATLADNLTTVLVGLAGVIGVVIVGWWQFGRTTATAERVEQAVGHPPEGDDRSLIELMHDFVATQAAQDKRLALLDLHRLEVERHIDDLRRTDADQAARLEAHAEMFEAHAAEIADLDAAIRSMRTGT